MYLHCSDHSLYQQLCVVYIVSLVWQYLILVPIKYNPVTSYTKQKIESIDKYFTITALVINFYFYRVLYQQQDYTTNQLLCQILFTTQKSSMTIMSKHSNSKQQSKALTMDPTTLLTLSVYNDDHTQLIVLYKRRMRSNNQVRLNLCCHCLN